MCETCLELKQRFQATTNITERQSLWNLYDKQRKKCAKAEGKPIEAPKPEIKKEKKAKAKKAEPKKVEPAAEKEAPPIKSEKPAKDQKKWEPVPMEKPKKPSAEKPAENQKKTVCKYYYRGGLCANSQMDKPFCPCEGDFNKCPVKPKDVKP